MAKTLTAEQIDALRAAILAADEASGESMHKPAGRPAFRARAVPVELWDRIMAALPEAK